MKTGQVLSAICALASITSAAPGLKKRSSITPVTTYGNAFFAGNERFYIRGVDYQPGGSANPIDPLANPATCKRDIKYFKMLGINTIRVYTVNNAISHDECMDALAEAGMYLALDVNSGMYSLNRADPAPSYNNVYLQNVFAIIDAFAKYDNTLLFFSGNEVINTPGNTNTAPYIKAVTRDMKNYIQAQKYRAIPVGYSAADVSQNIYQTAHYLNCGPDAMARSDFFALNDYSWCGQSSFVESGWNVNVQDLNNYSIPVFLSEYGCNEVLPRTFTEVEALYNPEMTKVYSGGLVYEYSEEADNPNFGLVQITGPDSVKLLPDFNLLKNQLASNPSPSGSGGYHKNLPISQCPPYSNQWKVHGTALPAMPIPAEKYLKDGAGPGIGLKGKGSQTSGTPSASWVNVHDAGTSEGKAPSISSSSSSSSSSPNAAGSIRPLEWPVVAMAGGFVVLSSFFGTSFF